MKEEAFLNIYFCKGALHPGIDQRPQIKENEGQVGALEPGKRHHPPPKTNEA